jgi:hypothetical protein
MLQTLKDNAVGILAMTFGATTLALGAYVWMNPPAPRRPPPMNHATTPPYTPPNPLMVLASAQARMVASDKKCQTFRDQLMDIGHGPKLNKSATDQMLNVLVAAGNVGCVNEAARTNAN